MSEVKWHKRNTKRYYARLKRTLVRAGYFEDCNYHPCKITNLYMPIEYFRVSPIFPNENDWYIEGTSLITGKLVSCSMTHCGVEPLTEKEALDRAEHLKKKGTLSYMKTYKGLLPEYEEEYAKFDKEWGFSERAGVSL